MRTFIIILSVLLFQSCNNRAQRVGQTNLNVNDTTFLKTIKWDSLNTFVDYHILRQGTTTTDTSLYISLDGIALYQYLYTSFEQLNNSDTILKLKPHELREFILSDSFSNRKDFDCLLRINSKIMLYRRPELLETIFIRPKAMDNESIKPLIATLRKEKFVEEINTQELKPSMAYPLTGDTAKTTILKIKLRSEYRDLEKIERICEELKTRKEIDQAFFTDLFTGRNENEIIFRMTTDEISSR